MPRKHSDDTIEAARILLAEGLTQRAISERLNIPPSTLRHHLREPRAVLALPSATQTRQRVTRKSFRPQLIARLWAMAERQVNEIDARLTEAGGDPASLERDAKTLSILARTLRDLIALDQATAQKPKVSDAETEIPRDIDAFRRALAEKLVELGRLERDDKGAGEA